MRRILEEADALDGDSAKVKALEAGLAEVSVAKNALCRREILTEISLRYERTGDLARTQTSCLALLQPEMKLDADQAVRIRLRLARSYFRSGDPRAYEEALKAFDHYQSTNDRSDAMLETTELLAKTFELTGDDDEGYQHLEAALRQAEKEKDIRWTCSLLDRLGTISVRQGTTTKGIAYFQRSLSLMDDFFRHVELDTTVNGIVLTRGQYLRMRHGSLTGLGDALASAGRWDQAAASYAAATEIVGSSHIGSLRSPYVQLGEVRLAQGGAAEALSNGRLALAQAEGDRDTTAIKRAYDLLAKAHERQGNSGEALRMYRSGAVYDASVNSEKFKLGLVRSQVSSAARGDSLRLAMAAMESEERAKKSNEDATRFRNRALVAGGIGVILILGGLVVLLVMRGRQRKKELVRQQEINERLQNIDKLKDQFLANTSHELRTPLNGIIGLSESLYDGVAGPPTEAMKQDLGMIISSGKRLSGLLNDILDFSKLRERDIKLVLKPIDLRALVDVDLRILSPGTRGKDLKLVNAVPKDLVHAEADEDRLQQILMNLVGNAIKFSERGAVTVSAREVDGMLAVDVEDSGIGIPPDKLESIFKPFEQSDGTAQRQFGGTGLGLTITKQLVELHKGTLMVRSTLGKGSTFTFTLRKSTGKAEPMKAATGLARTRIIGEEEVLPTLQPAWKEGGFKILVVDDEAVNRKVLVNYMSDGSFNVEQASTGSEALKDMDEADYDLILLDVMMPGMSGYEVCEQIRKRYLSSELPVIMITAKDQVNDLVEGFKTGANDYLIKPVSRSELLARITMHLNLLKINNSYSRFVPRDFLRSLGKENIIDVKLGDQIQDDLTVMFSDIRSYTTLSESMRVDENFRFLNAFLGRVGPVIQKHNGFVNQFLGDGLMTLFQRHPEDCLKASLEMHAAVADYNKYRATKGRIPIRIGIGMHYGSLMMGIIGDNKRMDAGVVSDTVNTASRVEGLTKYYGASTLLSQATVERIGDISTYQHRLLGQVLMKGKVTPMALFEFYGGDPPTKIELRDKNKPTFQKGLEAYYQREFELASRLFGQVLSTDPDDLAAQLYVRNCATYVTHGVPDHWTGVEEMLSK